MEENSNKRKELTIKLEVNMEKLTDNYCVARHIKSFYEQAKKEMKADFGEPCEGCKNWDECKGDWLSKIGKSIIDETKFSMVN